MYLNTIDYANFAFGAEAAPRGILARVPGPDAWRSRPPGRTAQAPGEYTPAIPENRDRAKARQVEVLDLMIKHLDEVNAIPNSADPSQPSCS